MKKIFTFIALLCVAISLSADIRVLSDTRIGEGFFPRFADAETVTYLTKETARYIQPVASDASLRVDNENLNLNLYRNGERIVLKPHGDVNYIWSSLSPNQQMILFNTKYGTAICDLNGQEIINLGQDFNAPVWYGNDYVVGMDDNHDGYFITESSIMMASVDGSVVERLSAPEGMAMYPNVDARSGRIVYNTDNGDIHLMQINLTEEPIRKQAPRLVQEVDDAVLKHVQREARRAASSDPSSFKIYINPGHGGYDSDDRLMYIYPVFIDGNQVNEAGGYTREMSFWESTSNLDKGMRLDTILRDLGFQTKMSRITNTTDDDRSLSGIVEEANQWGSDFMLSIHSNAGNPSNYILQLYSGITPGDNRTYSHMPANSETSRKITTLMGDNQYLNQISCWSRVPYIAGDKTFAKDIMGWSNGYGVLRWLTVPGTISEGMMHDYLPETYRLMNIDYKRQEAFYFAKTFIEWFCDGQLKDGAIGGKIHDVYQKQTFPDYKPRKNTRDVLRPINRGLVELWQGDQLLDTYVTDTMYNGCYFFWNLQPGTYTVKAKPEGYYPQEQTLEVKQNEISYGIFELSMARQTPPVVLDYSPKVTADETVLVSATVTIAFNWDMETEATAAALEISPAVEGTVTFEDDNHTLRFTPTTRFEPGVTYTVTMGTGACHPDTVYENHLQEPFSFQFTTSNRGAVTVVQTYPNAGATNVPLNPSLIMVFDAKIINKTVSNNVALLDMDGNTPVGPDGKEIKINTRGAKFNQAPAPYGHAAYEIGSAGLMPNTDYQLVLYPAVSDVDGVLLNDTISIPFRTGEAVEPTMPLVDQMEAAFFMVDKEASIDASGLSVLADKNKKYAGSYSNKMAYTFNAVGGEAIFNAIDPTLIVGNSESKLGMYVGADYSFNALYAKWATDGDIKYTKICDLDYAGWLYQEADMSELPAGVDYQFMGLRLVGADNLLSASGAFNIDNVHVEYVQPGTGTAVEDIMQPSAEGKIIEGGYLYILLNGKRYNAQGAVVK